MLIFKSNIMTYEINLDNDNTTTNTLSTNNKKLVRLNQLTDIEIDTLLLIGCLILALIMLSVIVILYV